MSGYSENVMICEVSTRDGFQTLMPPTVDEKLHLIDLIVNSGIKCIEYGSFSFLKDGKEDDRCPTSVVTRRLKRVPGVSYRAMLQKPYEMKIAVDSGVDYIKLNVSACEEHYRKMTGNSIEEGMTGFKEIGTIAERNNVSILGSISLAFTSPYAGIIPKDRVAEIISRFIDCGATEISLNDTAGLAFPNQVNDLFTDMMSRFLGIKTWCFHAHNTRGTGLANVLGALNAGVTRIDSSLAGIGGCPVFKNASGNISTEDLTYLLNGMGIDTGVNLAKIINAGKYIETLVPPDKTDSYIQRLEKIKEQQKEIE